MKPASIFPLNLNNKSIIFNKSKPHFTSVLLQFGKTFSFLRSNLQLKGYLLYEDSYTHTHHTHTHHTHTHTHTHNQLPYRSTN